MIIVAVAELKLTTPRIEIRFVFDIATGVDLPRSSLQMIGETTS
jgi:hypothetical protein